MNLEQDPFVDARGLTVVHVDLDRSAVEALCGGDEIRVHLGAVEARDPQNVVGHRCRTERRARPGLLSQHGERGRHIAQAELMTHLVNERDPHVSRAGVVAWDGDERLARQLIVREPHVAFRVITGVPGFEAEVHVSVRGEAVEAVDLRASDAGYFVEPVTGLDDALVRGTREGVRHRNVRHIAPARDGRQVGFPGRGRARADAARVAHFEQVLGIELHRSAETRIHERERGRVFWAQHECEGDERERRSTNESFE